MRTTSGIFLCCKAEGVGWGECGWELQPIGQGIFFSREGAHSSDSYRNGCRPDSQLREVAHPLPAGAGHALDPLPHRQPDGAKLDFARIQPAGAKLNFGPAMTLRHSGATPPILPRSKRRGCHAFQGPAGAGSRLVAVAAALPFQYLCPRRFSRCPKSTVTNTRSCDLLQVATHPECQFASQFASLALCLHEFASLALCLHACTR